MMIPRLLVPLNAQPPAAEDAATQRRRPTTMDERRLIPAMLPIVYLDGHTSIPTELPLDSIVARVVVPRDVKKSAYAVEDRAETKPLQATEMDERITVPQGSAPPEITAAPQNIPTDLVEGDIFITGEVHLLAEPESAATSKKVLIVRVASVAFHVIAIGLIFLIPWLFPPHVPTQEELELARNQTTLLLPTDALDLAKPEPPRPVVKSNPVHVDPREIRRVAPTIVPPPVPQPEVKNLPSAPVPQTNPDPPKSETLVAKNDAPKPPVRLETPDQQPTPHGLLLPKTSPGSSIRDSIRDAARSPTPTPIGGEAPLPSLPGGGGGQGTAGTGLEILSDTQGVDFNNYLSRVYITVRRNWIAVFPESARLGDRGIVSLEFRIMKDGTVTVGEPALVRTSGKEPLDRAAISSVRASTPFEPLPSEFHGPFIALRFTYYYNLPIDAR
jgi:outer membrane biosynthesis protein TonB